jgi:hypothetical protein
MMELCPMPDGSNGHAGGPTCWSMNTTIRHNNISRVMGVDAVDGLHVCVRGDNNGAGTGSRYGNGAGCRNLSWAIYLDGGDGHGGGGCGFHVHGNVIDASTSGAILVNGGGNVNFTNNVIIDDSTTDFDICVGQNSSWDGCNCSQPNSYLVSMSADCLNACAHQGMCEGNGGTPGQNTRDYVPGSPSGAVTVIACALRSVCLRLHSPASPDYASVCVRQ